MNGFILDTNVISLLAPARPAITESSVAWLEAMDRRGKVFLTVVTVHEIEKGIALLDAKGAMAKASNLRVA